MNQDIVSYYKDRSKEYDKVYQIPEEQEDLRKATKVFQALFSQKKVLEIACGTGYWTAGIGKTAISVHATDINENVIEIAKDRNSIANTSFEVANMYSLTTVDKYDGLFGGFIWSHILLQDLDRFMNKLAGLLTPNAAIAFIDSKQVIGRVHDSKSITYTDGQGNTYQGRTLENGTRHLVLKNFPTKEFLLQKLSTIATEISFIDLDHYWIISGKLL